MAPLPTDYLGQNDSYWKRKRHAVSKVAVSYANGYDKAIRLCPGLSDLLPEKWLRLQAVANEPDRAAKIDWAVRLVSGWFRVVPVSENKN